jgi:Putative Ig domain
MFVKAILLSLTALVNVSAFAQNVPPLPPNTPVISYGNLTTNTPTCTIFRDGSYDLFNSAGIATNYTNPGGFPATTNYPTVCGKAPGAVNLGSLALDATACVGGAFNLAMNPTGTGPFTYVLGVPTTSLPLGITFNAATGSFSGVPTTAGTYLAVVQITNASTTGLAAVFLLTVDPVCVVNPPKPLNNVAQPVPAVGIPVLAISAIALFGLARRRIRKA